MMVANFQTFRALFATVVVPLDPDGLEPWPLSMVRAAGFTSGFTGIPKPITAFPIDVSVDGEAAGALAYHVYLSQRTDDPAKQYLSIIQKAGKSGTFTISLTALAVSDLGLSGPTDTVSPEDVRRLLNRCHLYVQRIADDAIQWVDLLAASNANPS